LIFARVPNTPVPLDSRLALQISENTGNMIYRFENQKITDCFFRVFSGKNFRRKIDRIFQKHIGFKTTVLGWDVKSFL